MPPLLLLRPLNCLSSLVPLPPLLLLQPPNHLSSLPPLLPLLLLRPPNCLSSSLPCRSTAAAASRLSLLLAANAPPANAATKLSLLFAAAATPIASVATVKPMAYNDVDDKDNN